MTRHLGVNVFFSVLIVIFFAVILYQPEEPLADAHASAVKPAESESEPPSPASASPVAEATPLPAAPRPTEEAPQAPPVVHTIPTSHRPAVAQAETSSSQSKPSRPARAVPRASKPTKPRPRGSVSTSRTPFIQAGAGETLDDVALRVFGSSDAARALWMANRDILPDRDSPLSAGMVLRTP